MLKKIFIILTAIVAAGGILFAAGCGYRHRGTPEEKAEWIVDRIKNKLDLSEAQVAEVNKIKDEILAKKDDFKSLHEGFYETMQYQIRSDKFDTDAVNQLFASKETRFRELRAFMVSEAAKFHAILTPEQREKLAKELEERHKDRYNK